MRRLTPELYALSAFDGTIAGGDTLETRELDFNLSRRSAIVINQITGQMNVGPAVAADHFTSVVQELDLDPDNLDVWQGSPTPDAIEYDSSRLYRQIMAVIVSIVATSSLAVTQYGILEKDWHNVPIEMRPISITNLRHHVNAVSGPASADSYHAELHIYYAIYELSLDELGIINASRR